MALLDLDLEDADIDVTDLRNLNKLAQRLRTKRRLRVKQGTRTIGVFVSPPAWQELQKRFDALEAELELRDDEALMRLVIERRRGGEAWVQGSPESAAAALAEFVQIDETIAP